MKHDNFEFVDGTYDYKRIKKELGLTPDKWHSLLSEANKRFNERHYSDRIEVFNCACQSAFCEQCAKNSPSFKEILKIIETMNYKKVRNIMLSVDRGRFKTPESAFEYISKNKKINHLVKKLESIFGKHFNYLWVIEFHSDGYPHYHLLIEGIETMLKKELIQEIWRIGNVWESYIKDQDHFDKIKGYGRKTGYFAGEQKKHQLTLPEGLKKLKVIRKFGTNIKREEKIRKSIKKRQIHKAKRTFEERFKECGTSCKIHDMGYETWTEIKKPYKETKELIIELGGEEMTYKEFNVKDSRDIIFKISASHLPDVPRGTFGRSIH